MRVDGPIWQGLTLSVVSGLAAGTAMLPMKFVRRWQWENIWLVFSCFSQVILPACLAALFVRRLATVYDTVSASQLAVPALLGMGWGLGNVLFGLSIARLGLALGYAIIMGSTAMLGTLLPLALDGRSLFSASSLVVFAGVLLMGAGIAVSGWAGRLRELAVPTRERPKRTNSYGVSLLLAIGCCLLSPMLNYSFVSAHPIAALAVRLGNPTVRAAYAVWPVTLLGGFLVNLAYCLLLLWKNRSWTFFRTEPNDARQAVAMAVLWMGSLSLYGMAAAWLGTLGASVGWGLVQAIAIIAANVAGLWSGEWAASPRGARRLLLAGVALLTLATIVMATGLRFRM